MRGRMQMMLPVLGALLLGAPVAAQQAPDPGTRPARQSWTSDRRDFSVGDVLTVLIDEYTLASAHMGEVHSDRRSRDLGVGAGQNVTQSLPPALGADFGSRNDAESRQRGEATRQNRFRGEMTVRVVEVLPGGLLRVEGRKLVKVDKAQEELTLTGFIRPEDISARNMVDSWRVGDAELVYASRGGLGRPRGSILSRLLGWVWP